MVTTTSEKYKTAFGFTEEEVKDALSKFNLSGRYDVMMEPLQDTLPAFVLEFKVINPAREKNLEETLKNALSQIDEKAYDTELMARGIAKERIQHYGFAFEGKNVLIG